MKLVTITALAVLIVAPTAFAAKCKPNHMLDQISQTAEVKTSSLDGKQKLFMSYDSKSDKIFVVSQNVKTCKIDSDFMTSEQVFTKFHTSYEEYLEGNEPEG